MTPAMAARCPGHDGTRPTPSFRWEQTKTGPRCADCSVAWPGHPLPAPAHKVEGYGHVAQQPGWGERVRRMTTELQEVMADA